MTSLYNLADEYRAAAEILADLDLDAQTIVDTLEGMSGELESKAQNVVMFARNLEANAKAIKEAEAEMSKRRKAMENRADGLRRYILAAMQHADIEKIECPYFRISVRNNPPAVEIFDEAMLPTEFLAVPTPPPPAPDKTAIKEAIKAGIEVPGARLTAGVRLEVK